MAYKLKSPIRPKVSGPYAGVTKPKYKKGKK